MVSPQFNFDILVNPDLYGFTVCTHCNGYGSSLKDPEDVYRCTECNGLGVYEVEREGLDEDED